jgi:hypothetical protein
VKQLQCSRHIPVLHNINGYGCILTEIKLYEKDFGAGIAQLVQSLGYRLDDRGSILAAAIIRFFLCATASRQALGPTQLPIQWVPSALSLGVKRPGREAHHSPPSIVEVKNA